MCASFQRVFILAETFAGRLCDGYDRKYVCSPSSCHIRCLTRSLTPPSTSTKEDATYLAGVDLLAGEGIVVCPHVEDCAPLARSTTRMFGEMICGGRMLMDGIAYWLVSFDVVWVAVWCVT